MEISHERIGDAQRILFTGEMTIYHALEMKHALLDALGTTQELEVNLAAVECIDTVGLQLLYLTKREALRHGKQLHLLHHSPAVREVLDIYHLTAYFGDPMLIPAERPTTAPEPTPAAAAAPENIRDCVDELVTRPAAPAARAKSSRKRRT